MEKQIVLITGSSTGFGRRTAEALAHDGHTVFATMRNTQGSNQPHAERLRALARQSGYDIHVLDLDVTSGDSVQQALDEVAARAGRLDVLLNNAGYWGPGVLEAYTMPQWQQLFDVNVFGCVRLMRAALPLMRRQGSGLVVQMSSLQARFILPYSGPYVASKWAVEGAMETFRYEVAPFGVEVCIVEPYDFLTEMKEKARHYTAQDLARQLEYGPANDLINNLYLVPDPTRAGDPQLVVDALRHLIQTPPGQRPVRTTVSNPMPQIEEINRLSQEMLQGLFPYIGLRNLLHVATPNSPENVH